MEKNEFLSLTASASITNKSENQDAHAVLRNTLIVTDGLGSLQHAKTAAKFVAGYFKDTLTKDPQQDLTILFADAKRYLTEIAQEEKRESEKTEVEPGSSYGTTAIVVREEAYGYTGAYAGNGALWHIRGNFTDFPAPYLFPWNAINYLNPHSIPENGKEALYRLISDSDAMIEASPSIVSISKDHYFGDIIMICTDGVHSADQFDAGTNSKGVWVKYEEQMLRFFNLLKEFFSNTGNFDQQGVQNFLSRYTESIRPVIDDDATLAIFISSQAFRYQYERLEREQTIQNQKDIEAILNEEPADGSAGTLSQEESHHESENTDQSV